MVTFGSRRTFVADPVRGEARIAPDFCSSCHAKTRGQWFSTSFPSTWAAGKNLKVRLARVHKLSIQSANDGWIMDGPINEAWHEFYIPDPAGNEIKWLLNVTVTTVTAHKSLFCTNLHASRFHESHIKFTFYSNRQSLTTEGALFEFCVTILPPLHPHPHVSTLWWPLFLSRLFLFMVRGSWLTWFPCGAHERARARTRKRKSHLESCHLNFISSSDPEKIQRTKTKQNKTNILGSSHFSTAGIYPGFS